MANESNKKTLAIIQARMNSSRLPGKVLMPINERPMLDYMIERVSSASAIDDFVVATSNESSDNPIEEFCKDNNVRVISISDNIDTTDGGKSELLLNILLSIATEEKRMIKERCSSGRDMKWKNKELPYGKISFGYKRVKNGSLELDNNSEIVKYIFTKWNALLKLNLTKTKRTQKMLKLLANRGYTYFGNPFKGYHLKQILQNKFYCGIMRWKNEEQTSGYDSIISLRLYNQIQNSFNN